MGGLWGSAVARFTRPASAARARKSRTCERWYLWDTILERLAPDLQDIAAARRPCTQAAHPVVGERHRARPRHVAPTDPPHIGDGVRGGATRPGRDHRRAAAGAAGNVVEARNLDGLGQAHGREHGGEAAASIDVPSRTGLNMKIQWSTPAYGSARRGRRWPSRGDTPLSCARLIHTSAAAIFPWVRSLPAGQLVPLMPNEHNVFPLWGCRAVFGPRIDGFMLRPGHVERHD
jgi:hypothetical protein